LYSQSDLLQKSQSPEGETITDVEEFIKTSLTK